MQMELDVEADHKSRAARRAVAENRRKLTACVLHSFDSKTIDWHRGLVPATLLCTICGGREETLAAVAYARGYAAAGGDPEMVIEGFTR